LSFKRLAGLHRREFAGQSCAGALEDWKRNCFLVLRHHRSSDQHLVFYRRHLRFFCQDRASHINGVDDGATVYSGTVPALLFINTSEHVVIGDTVNGSFANFNGQIDDVRIYNRALSAAEIAALYGGGCSNPAGNAGAIMYNNAFSVMQYCNGSAWIPMAQP
jgi:hypothetical protein